MTVAYGVRGRSYHHMDRHQYYQQLNHYPWTMFECYMLNTLDLTLALRYLLLSSGGCSTTCKLVSGFVILYDATHLQSRTTEQTALMLR